MTPSLYQITLTETERNTLITLLDKQFNLHDQLSLTLDKAYALSHVSVHWPDFMDIAPKIGLSYLETLYHLLDRVIESHDAVHQAFLQLRKLIPSHREEGMT